MSSNDASFRRFCIISQHDGRVHRQEHRQAAGRIEHLCRGRIDATLRHPGPPAACPRPSVYLSSAVRTIATEVRALRRLHAGRLAIPRVFFPADGRGWGVRRRRNEPESEIARHSRVVGAAMMGCKPGAHSVRTSPTVAGMKLHRAALQIPLDCQVVLS